MIAFSCKLRILFFTVFFIVLSSTLGAQSVYITKTGTKYHTSTCKHLGSSKISISLSDAKEKGYTPCKVCKPSSTVSSSTKDQDATTVKTTPKGTQTTKPATSTNTTSKQCSAITQKGTQCKRKTNSPNGKCWQHGGN